MDPTPLINAAGDPWAGAVMAIVLALGQVAHLVTAAIKERNAALRARNESLGLTLERRDTLIENLRNENVEWRTRALIAEARVVDLSSDGHVALNLEELERS